MIASSPNPQALPSQAPGKPIPKAFPKAISPTKILTKTPLPPSALAYLADLARKAGSAHTLRSYRSNLLDFYSTPTIPLPIDEPTILAYVDALIEKGLAHATISLVVLEEAPDGGVGAASAAMQITSAIGVALGTGATGTLMSMSASQTRGLVLGFLTTTAAAAAALVVAARLPGRPR